jgi:hypothetical protein
VKKSTPKQAPPQNVLVLDSGRRIDVDSSDGDRISITSPDGTFELAVTFGPAGPVLRVSAAALEFRARGAMDLDCESLSINARGPVAIRARDLTEEIEGTRTSVGGGKSTHEAHAV